MRGHAHLFILTIFFFACSGDDKRQMPQGSGQPDLSTPLMLSANDVRVDWVMRSSEGTVATEGTCNHIAISYDRSTYLMAEIIQGLNFELLGTNCTTNDRGKDQFMYSYLFNSDEGVGMVSARVYHFDKGNSVDVIIGMGEKEHRVAGTIEYRGTAVTVYMELPLSQLGLGPQITALVTTWAERTGTQEGLSEVLELQFHADFKPYRAGV